MKIKYLNVDLRGFTEECQKDTENLLSDEEIDKIELDGDRIEADYIRGENAAIRDMAYLALRQGYEEPDGAILQAFSIPFLESTNVVTGEPTYHTKADSYKEVTLSNNGYVAQPEYEEMRFSDFTAFGMSEGFLDCHHATFTDEPEFDIPSEYDEYIKLQNKYPDHESEFKDNRQNTVEYDGGGLSI